MTIAIAGAGRVARALGRRLHERGLPVSAVASRNPGHAREAAAFIGRQTPESKPIPVPFSELRAAVVLIAVPDRVIVEVARLMPAPAVALHTCGAHGAELLAGVFPTETRCGALHPLQTFANPEAGYGALPGCAFAIDGDAEALSSAETIARLLEGPILRIPGPSRALYHAAAAMASNHLVAVLDAAIAMMVEAGVPEETARLALGPIARQALENTLATGAERALTGPVERGDLETVQRHLRGVDRLPQTIGNLYRAAALQALAIARRRVLDSGGLESGTALRLEQMLKAPRAAAETSR